MAGVGNVSARIASAGYPQVSLYRGKGYHYFIYDDGMAYECHSVMVMHFRDLPIDRWVADGIEFGKFISAREF